ncbi:MAG: hypothetical protein EOO00_02495 [Chitinophagaceae bacterium]|nr:MAG: hypothetical protein EOO00_02495 [Chitinophagaceae bacterium]
MLFLVQLCPEVGWSAGVHWDGEGNDGSWQNPLNWVGDLLPADGDDVILDNSVVLFPYEVMFGSGDLTVALRSLTIRPSGGVVISCVVPVTNIAVPALRCRGAVYGLALFPGAIFSNASGADAGMTIEVDDSIRINNGARYVHMTPRSHADNIRSLSRDAGTELGEFEFRIPVASSTISVSGQVFGKLILSTGPLGIVNYTGTGTNGMTIRSDLQIGAGVNLSLNLEPVMVVGRDLVQSGGTMNIGTTARKLRVEIGRHLKQFAGALISESGTAKPEIMMNGTGPQEVSIAGQIENEISFAVNCTGEILLTHRLDLPHHLALLNGIIRTDTNIIRLGPTCTLSCSDSTITFIDGKLRKDGLIGEDFMFPVGKERTMRWVGLRNAAGNFLVEYVRSNPRDLESNLPAVIDHISALEYWNISALTPTSLANVELSFHDVNSGGVTDLQQLRVARLQPGSWQDGGNIAVTGSAGSEGSVTGHMIDSWDQDEATIFTLASTVATQNPLPVRWLSFSAIRVQEKILVAWSAEEENSSHYEIERSFDGHSFEVIAKINATGGKAGYSWTDAQERLTGTNYNGQLYYQVILVQHSGLRIPTHVERVTPVFLNNPSGSEKSAVLAHITKGSAKFVSDVALQGITEINLFTLNGELVHRTSVNNPGKNFVITGIASQLKMQPVLIRIRSRNVNLSFISMIMD